MQVASIIPSSKVLVHKVAGKMDLSEPRVIVEFLPSGDAFEPGSLTGIFDITLRSVR